MFRDIFEGLFFRIFKLKSSKSQKEILVNLLNYLSINYSLEKIFKGRGSENLPNIFRYNLWLKGGAVSAAGFDFNSDEVALSRAIGEYIERLTLADFDKKVSLNEFSIAELRKLFHIKLQYDFFENSHLDSIRKVDENVKIKAVSMYDLANNKTVFYPAQTVFFGREDCLSEPFRIVDMNSSGGGGGFTYEQAVLSGLYELIERDAFLLFWLNKRPVYEIERRTLPGIILEKLNYLLRYRVEVRVFDLTSDIGIPVIMCMFTDLSNPQKPISFSCASGLDLEQIILKAVKEVYQLADFFTEVKSSNFSYSKDITIHNRFWLINNENLGEVEFLSNVGTVTYPKLSDEYSKTKPKSKKQEIDFLLASLKCLGNFNVYVYNHKNAELYRMGYNVVKVVCPQLLHLYLDERMKYVIGERIQAYRNFFKIEGDYKPNVFPHPFP